MDARYLLRQIGNNARRNARGGSHDLSSVTVADSSFMLVILVYHTSCRYARENRKISKIFDFRKEKGVWGKAPFFVFWRMPKHKKDKKKAFRHFFFFTSLFSIHDDNSQDFTVWCHFFCDGLILIYALVLVCGFPNYICLQVVVAFK